MVDLLLFHTDVTVQQDLLSWILLPSEEEGVGDLELLDPGLFLSPDEEDGDDESLKDEGVALRSFVIKFNGDGGDGRESFFSSGKITLILEEQDGGTISSGKITTSLPLLLVMFEALLALGYLSSFLLRSLDSLSLDLPLNNRIKVLAVFEEGRVA